MCCCWSTPDDCCLTTNATATVVGAAANVDVVVGAVVTKMSEGLVGEGLSLRVIPFRADRAKHSSRR